MISLSFILTSIIVIIIPGTGAIYTITTGLAGNKRNAIYAALGCTLGIVPHIFAGIVGISAILNTSAQLFKIVKIIGVIYLLYLGIGLLRSKSEIKIEEGQNEVTSKIIIKAILLNLLNPKLTIFFLSFLPQFINPSGMSSNYQMVILSLIFMILTFVVFITYGILANSFKNILKESPKITKRIQQSFGVIIMGFAAKLAIDN
ncbi:MAG: LysE family translocator [Spirochaetaceae bacterium]